MGGVLANLFGRAETLEINASTGLHSSSPLQVSIFLIFKVEFYKATVWQS